MKRGRQSVLIVEPVDAGVWRLVEIRARRRRTVMTDTSRAALIAIGRRRADAEGIRLEVRG